MRDFLEMRKVVSDEGLVGWELERGGGKELVEEMDEGGEILGLGREGKGKCKKEGRGRESKEL